MQQLEELELYAHTGGEAGETPRVFLCRPGIDDNVAEVFAHGGIGADELAARLACSVNAVTRIVAELNREPEWDSDTMSAVANILHEEGFKLKTAEEHDDGFDDALAEIVRATAAHGGGDGK